MDLAKTRVEPKKGSSVPKMELRSFLQCLRMPRLVLRTSHLTIPHKRIMRDSECTVAALRKQGSTLTPYFQNRVSKACEIMAEIVDMTGRDMEVRLTPGAQNTVDLNTRDNGTAADIAFPAQAISLTVQTPGLTTFSHKTEARYLSWKSGNKSLYPGA